jgi:hypothetical protein
VDREDDVDVARVVSDAMREIERRDKPHPRRAI